MREYLELGQLAHIDGNCLYMHGGIVGGGCRADEHAVGAVPNSDQRIDDVHEWVSALNAWKREQIDEWINEPQWSGRLDDGETSGPAQQWRSLDGYLMRGGGQTLQDYGLFTENGPTVVLGRHLQKTGMPVCCTAPPASLRLT
jgi:hypothetical protein